MKSFRFTLILALVSFCLLCSAALAGTPKHIVTMVATDDVNRAAMAIEFTHAAMINKGLDATIFFNVYGVNLVNKEMPSPLYPNDKSIRAMLESFMKDGGSVLACPMCMKNVGGMENADLMQGVVAQKGGGMTAVTQPDTLVLNY